MIAIIAAQNDEPARWLTARWEANGARLLTPKDLSVPGWRYKPHPGRDYTAIVSKKSVTGTEIAGVLTRLAWVLEQDVPHLVSHDRAYVAAEMTAFLSSWLSGLKCPVINRPTPTCLVGPAWRQEQWVHAAARLGIPICPVRRNTRRHENAAEDEHPLPVCSVTVVAGHSFGASDNLIQGYARRLASAVGVDLLAAHFVRVDETYKFASADLWPDVTVPEVADAILDSLLGRHTC
jgi:hypothetical protein